jgi:hypothetical protein
VLRDAVEETHRIAPKWGKNGVRGRPSWADEQRLDIGSQLDQSFGTTRQMRKVLLFECPTFSQRAPELFAGIVGFIHQLSRFEPKKGWTAGRNCSQFPNFSPGNSIVFPTVLAQA